MAEDLFARLDAIGRIVGGGTATFDLGLDFAADEAGHEGHDHAAEVAAPGDWSGSFDSDRVGASGQQLAEQYGLRLSSHRRSPEHNAAIGGARRSDHLTGMAVDLAGDTAKMEALYRWAKPLEGIVFRKVIYKYEDPGDHSDHVHLSFLSESTGGQAAIGSDIATNSDPVNTDDLFTRAQAIHDVIGGKGAKRASAQRDSLGLRNMSKDMAQRFANARKGVKPAPQSIRNSSGGAANFDSGAKGTYQQYAFSLFDQYGWSESEMAPLIELWNRESGWNPNAQNPTSTAFGIAQFLNSTWSGVGAKKTTDPFGQIDAGLKYIKRRFGSPSMALAFWQANRWY